MSEGLVCKGMEQKMQGRLLLVLVLHYACFSADESSAAPAAGP
jgi:hypothetical protein